MGARVIPFIGQESIDLRGYRFPCAAELYGDGWTMDDGCTAYGFATAATRLVTPSGMFSLSAGMYFASPGPLKVHGRGLVVMRFSYRGLFVIGGPIEERGRLRYIDGCSDTLLIGPPRRGDPCLNHLHFPAGIKQTMHTHPSVRIGVVASGHGECVTPAGVFNLVPGLLWFLPENAEHCFYTYDSTMDVIAWHPDTDTGPSDEDHPMLNRTIVNGRSARDLDAIRTVELTPRVAAMN